MAASRTRKLKAVQKKLANKLKGEYAITLKGETHLVIFNMNALALLQDKLELNSLLDLQRMLTGVMPIKALRAMLWAGLLHENPERTEEQIGDMVDVPIMSLLEPIGLALRLALFGVPDDEKPKDETAEGGDAAKNAEGATSPNGAASPPSTAPASDSDSPIASSGS